MTPQQQFPYDITPLANLEKVHTGFRVDINDHVLILEVGTGAMGRKW